MLEIGATVIIVNALQNRQQVTFKELKEIRKKVEAKFPQVYMDIVGESVNYACWSSAEYFIRQKTFIERGPKWTALTGKEIADTFNWHIPDDVRESIVKLISEIE